MTTQDIPFNIVRSHRVKYDKPVVELRLKSTDQLFAVLSQTEESQKFRIEIFEGNKPFPMWEFDYLDFREHLRLAFKCLVEYNA